MTAPSVSGTDLLAAATEDFRLNHRFPRARALLVDYYTKLGLSPADLRQAMQDAAAPRRTSIRVDLPESLAA